MVFRDKTFCSYEDCQFTDCDRHLIQLEGVDSWVSVADFSETCRRYNAQMVYEELKGEEK